MAELLFVNVLCQLFITLCRPPRCGINTINSPIVLPPLSGVFSQPRNTLATLVQSGGEMGPHCPISLYNLGTMPRCCCSLVAHSGLRLLYLLAPGVLSPSRRLRAKQTRPRYIEWPDSTRLHQMRFPPPSRTNIYSGAIADGSLLRSMYLGGQSLD